MKNKGKWKCSICESEFDNEGDVEMSITDSGKNVCAFCLKNVAVYSVTKTMPPDSRCYGLAECKGYDLSTPWTASKSEARKLIVEAIAAMKSVWGDVERVED